MNKDFLFILKLFIFWWLGLLMVSFLAMKMLPFRPSFPYYDAILAKLSPYQFIWQWANFDGPHYLTIAKEGYLKTNFIQAYFPLYPILISILNKTFKNLLFSGLFVSNVSFILALYFFNKLIKMEKIKYNYFSPIIFLLLFPTSFYFGALYSESLFFLLTLLSFIFMAKKKWFWSALFAGLASATRIVGIFIAPALIWKYYQVNFKKSKNKKKNLIMLILISFLSILGFIIYSLYLERHFNDPFYFATVQSAFGGSRQTNRLILYYQVVWRYIKMIFTMDKNNFIFYTILQEFILSIFALVILIWGWIKKIKKHYLIFSYFSYFLPTLTGNFSSMPRYIALIFPIYFLLAQIKNKKFQILLLTIFTCLLITNIALFLRGFWVA